MTSTLITRLSGRRAVLQLRPTRVGRDVWAGELRTDTGQPVHPNVQLSTPDTAGLHTVLARLSDLARLTAVPDLEEDAG